MTEPQDNSPRRATGTSPVVRHGLVAAVAAVAGFAAIYSTMQPSANTGEEPSSAQSTAERSTKAEPASEVKPAAPAPKTVAPASSSEKAAAPKALPSGPGRNELSVGDMAMFVFRDPQPMPDITFNDGTGTAKTFADWRGKVVLVNLWATWCAPCRKEMPDLDGLQKALGGPDFEVVAISLDRGSPDAPKKFLSEIKVENLALYHDPTARIGNPLKVIGLPATLLIDREGREIGRLVGPADWSSEDAIRLVKAAIADKSQ